MQIMRGRKHLEETGMSLSEIFDATLKACWVSARLGPQEVWV